jgi:heme/copper-type cytochrome/quinol oxidase subunit 2
MRDLNRDEAGSVAPLIIFLVTIFIVGFLAGVFGYLMIAVTSVDVPEVDVGGGVTVDANAGMNNLMDKVWFFLPIIILIVSISWLLMHAQKEAGGGWI